MFLGSFKTIFSGRNRIILPKRFRKVLGNEDKFYVLMGKNGEIWGFNQLNWLKLVDDTLKLPLDSEEGRVKRLQLFPKAEECVLDGQGRFILPQELAERVDFKQEILIIGAGDHFEIWDSKLWQKQIERIEKEYGKIP